MVKEYSADGMLERAVDLLTNEQLQSRIDSVYDQALNDETADVGAVAVEFQRLVDESRRRREAKRELGRRLREGGK